MASALHVFRNRPLWILDDVNTRRSDDVPVDGSRTPMTSRNDFRLFAFELLLLQNRKLDDCAKFRRRPSMSPEPIEPTPNKLRGANPRADLSGERLQATCCIFSDVTAINTFFFFFPGPAAWSSRRHLGSNWRLRSLLHSCTPSLPHSLTPFAHFAYPGICPRLPAPSPTPLARSSASRTEVLGVAGPSKRDKALFRSRRRKRWVLCMLIDCARTKYHTKHPLFPSIFPVTGHALRGNPCSSWCLAV
jgi:hypothetical protein